VVPRSLLTNAVCAVGQVFQEVNVIALEIPIKVVDAENQNLLGATINVIPRSLLTNAVYAVGQVLQKVNVIVLEILTKAVDVESLAQWTA